MKGRLSIYNNDGKLIYRSKNLIVNKGREAQGDLLELKPSVKWEMAIGTNNTPPSYSDIGLGNQVAIKDVASITRLAFNRIRYEVVFTSGDYGGSNVQEAGLFITLDIGGNVTKLFARRTFPALSLGAGKTFSWDIFT